ncbi:hypothetical protein [Marinobacterium iners]|uniref:Uncharacterized protein n=1 Tax=Marinobacterium iners DSM 11526 TaxID=1122198 RepID=A0A1H3XC14_9GAMM|nr:hypothetical protein [Marinobacterium iners]SDZ96214.1 hypothetical protein SAMN02745729_10188 [Marinobacterium iners DSM 11526]
MKREQIKELAIANGFSLKPQPDGTNDLNPYVYEFAQALVEPLRRELDHQKLIHVGFTNNTQIEGAKQIVGSFYPSTENDNWIPVYMLAVHAHRCGHDSETFCHLLKLEKRSRELKQERDQLTVHIQRIDTLAWKFLTYPNEAQTLEDLNRALSNSPVQNIAQHDAEVIEGLRFPTMLRKMWSGTEVQQWLKEQADQLHHRAKKV